MTPKHPKPIWLDRFAMHLGTLRPNLPPGIAAAVAEAEFDEACYLEPEEAAQIYATDWAAHE
jgi:hypothetical protein